MIYSYVTLTGSLSILNTTINTFVLFKTLVAYLKQLFIWSNDLNTILPPLDELIMRHKSSSSTTEKSHIGRRLWCIYSQNTQMSNKYICSHILVFNSSLVTIKRIAASRLPSSRVVFTLLIPEGPRVLHSWHSDLSPSSVTYYRRLLTLHNQFTAREERGSPSGGEKKEDETRLSLKNKLMEIVDLLWSLLTRSRTTVRYDESVSW